MDPPFVTTDHRRVVGQSRPLGCLDQMPVIAIRANIMWNGGKYQGKSHKRNKSYAKPMSSILVALITL